MKKLSVLVLLMGIMIFFVSQCKKKESSCVEKAWYQDYDKDGRGNPEKKKMACEQPDGYVANNTDENDYCVEVLFYQDTDGDGRGNINVSILDCEPPDGYVADSTDADDSCVELHFYEDADDDGLGNPDITMFVCEQPSGYVTNNEDEDDTTPCEQFTFYEDADDDGLGNPLSIIDSCAQPMGYVTNSDDPDDLSVCHEYRPDYAISDETFVFAIEGDLGNEGSVEESVANLIKSWDPAFIMTCGDNDYATDGTEFDGFDRGIGRYFHEYIYDYHGIHGEGSDTWRFFPAIGDHDGNGWEASSFSLENYMDFFSIANQDLPGGYNTGHGRYYQFRWGDVHFFVLNTWNWTLAEPDGATKDSEQAEWLKEQACASDALFKIVISHWPPYGSNEHWHTNDSDHLRDWRWKAMGIDIIFSGNDHGYERVVLPEGYKHKGINNGGVYGITTAGGGASIYQHSEPFHPGSMIRYAGHGASRITVTGNSLSHEFITPEGS
ncbi:MAG: metallophosphoesterase, partial [Caldisericaceae bacterium]|nr:metallophosphoesterase [Caldisericaceae bacterium]